MIVHRVRYKNLMAVGNAFVELELDAHRTTLVVGENGSGKSTLLEALSFGLYNRPFRRVNKSQLVNSITGRDLLVEVELTSGGSRYLVRRGMRPSVFEVWRDGVLVNQDAATRDYQEHLERDVLRMSHRTFFQIVVLGSADYVPFMQLPAGQRREVIEDLLDIRLFSVMNQLLRDRVTRNRDRIASIDTEIAVAENTLEVTRRHLEAARQDVGELISARRAVEASLLEEADRLRERLDAIGDASVDDLEEALRVATDRVADIDRLLDRLEARARTIRKTLAFLAENETCPTCRQAIDSGFRDVEVAARNARLDEVVSAIGALTTKREAALRLVEDARTALADGRRVVEDARETRSRLSLTNRRIRDVRTEIEELERRRDRPTTSTVDVAEVEARLEAMKAEREAATAERDVLALAGQLLKDGGIKTRIIRQYVPVINRTINRYLAALDFFVSFELDEEFCETIRSRHRDEFSYASFSEGEKARIDLAILFTWRTVARLRSSTSTNLLIMDEVFDSSLDNTGTEDLMRIIDTLTGDTNVFVISHRGDSLQDKFQNVVRFRKAANFSRIVS